VSLVYLHKNLMPNERPNILDYRSPKIKKIVPCLKNGKDYFDLQNGKRVLKTRDTLEWNVFPGTVFAYPKRNILISRRICDWRLLSVSMESEEFNPLSMVKYTMDETMDKN